VTMQEVFFSGALLGASGLATPFFWIFLLLPLLFSSQVFGDGI